jgi:hypothetical protein
MNAAGRREIERQLESWGRWMITHHSVKAGVPSNAILWFGGAGGGTPGSRDLAGGAPAHIQKTYGLICGLPEKEREAVFVFYALPASLDGVEFTPERRCFQCGLNPDSVRRSLYSARAMLLREVFPGTLTVGAD